MVLTGSCFKFRFLIFLSGSFLVFTPIAPKAIAAILYLFSLF